MLQCTNISSTFSKYCTGYYGFAFNGQEKDQEIYNNQSTTTATFWEYDGRIGRRWNIDPVVKEWESGYACFNGNPIIMIDPYGNNADKWDVNINTGKKTKTGDDGGKDIQIVHYYKENEKGDHIQVGSPTVIDGPEVYSGITRDGATISNVNLWDGVPQNLSGYKGYTYTASDLKMRYGIMNGNSRVLKQAIINFEKDGWAEPLTGENYWNLYGQTLGSLLAMQFYVTSGAGFASGAQGGNPNQISPKRFNYTSRYSNAETVYGYYGFDGDIVSYVGITNNTSIRFSVHSRSIGTGKESLIYRTQIKFDSRLKARIWEQKQINRFGLKNLINSRNEIRKSLWEQYKIE